MRWSLDPALCWKQCNDEHHSWFTANSTDPEVQREFWLLRNHNSCAGTCGQQQFVPSPGSSWELFQKSSKYPKYTLQNTEGGSTGTKGISLPSQCTAWVFSFLNFNPKRQQIFVWRSLKIDKDTIYPFLFLISHWTTAVQIFSLDQSNICILGNSDLQIKSEIMPQYFP